MSFGAFVAGRDRGESFTPTAEVGVIDLPGESLGQTVIR